MRRLIYWKVDINYLFHLHIIRNFLNLKLAIKWQRIVRLLLSINPHYERFWYCTTRGYLTTPHYQSVLPNWFFWNISRNKNVRFQLSSPHGICQDFNNGVQITLGMVPKISYTISISYVKICAYGLRIFIEDIA